MKLGARIGQGMTAEVFEWDGREDGGGVAAGGRVIKLFRPHAAGLADEEWEVSSRVSEIGLPVPRAYRQLEVEGRQGIVYERIDGMTLTRSLTMKPWRASAAGRQMAELHAAVHAEPAAGLPEQAARLDHRIAGAPGLDEASRSELRRRLAGLARQQQLCHGDFHPENVLLGARGPVIIDWMTAVQGSPEADAARSSLLLEYGALPPGMPAPVRIALTVLRRKVARAYLEGYVRLTGRTMEAIAAWRLPVAAARLVEYVPESEKAVLLKEIREGIARGV